MKKTLISLVFLVGFLGVVVVGCANKSTPSQPTTPQSTAQQPATQPSGQTGGMTSSQMSGMPQTATGDATKGKTLFDTNCSSCHNPDTTTKVGPGLKGIYSKSKLPDGNPVNDANLTQWMKIGNAKMPGNPALSSQDSADIEAYLKTLK